MRDSFDSKILRWAGFVMAGLLACAFMTTALPSSHGTGVRTVSAGLSAHRPLPVSRRG
jgi:hypothetical protein